MKYALIGCGRISPNHLEAAINNNLEIVGLCDIIPENIDYNQIPNLASEARQKLCEVRPTTIGQASRISGVNPADISILMVYLRRNS